MADDADNAPVVEVRGVGAPWGISPGDTVEVLGPGVDRCGRRFGELVGKQVAVEEVGFGYVKAGGVFWRPSGVRKTG